MSNELSYPSSKDIVTVDEETGDRGVMMIKWSLQITGKKSNQIEQPWLFPFTPITVHDGFNGFCFFDPWISRAGSPRF